MGFIHHHQIPLGVRNVRCFVPCKLVGTNDDFLAFKWPELPLPNRSIVGFCFENATWQKKLLGEFLLLLLSQV
jgi:hypothetical protein